MLTLLICVMLPTEKAISVDVVEHNTYGEHGSQQVILRQWSERADGYDHWVTDWRTCTAISAKRSRGVWTIDFIDCGGNHYELKTRTYRVTRTLHDPEVEQRKILAETDRNHRL